MGMMVARWLRRLADRLDPAPRGLSDRGAAMLAEMKEIRRLLRDRDRPTREEVRDAVRGT